MMINIKDERYLGFKVSPGAQVYIDDLGQRIEELEKALQSIADNTNASSRSLCYTAEQILKKQI